MRRAAAALLLQLARKTQPLAAEVCAGGCPAALAKYLQLEKEGEGCSTGVTLAGTLASYSPTTAKAVVDATVGSEVVQALRNGGGAAGAGNMLKETGGSTLKGLSRSTTGMGRKVAAGAGGPGVSVPAAAAWALEQMSQHGDETTMPLIAQGALTAAVDGYVASADAAAAAPEGPEAAVFVRCKAAVKTLIRNCSSTAPLEPLVVDATPAPVLKHVLRKAVPLLSRDAKARQQFVTSGGLMRLQELEHGLCPKGRAYLEEINQLFPADVVAYYRQGGGK